MCGIGGILRVYPPGVTPPAPEESIPEAWLDVLDASIRHRGPDGQGRFRDRAVRDDGSIVDVALVHRRLSIIDHACGAQPMVVFPSTRGLPARATALSVPFAFRDLQLPVVFHGSPNAPVQYRSVAADEGRQRRLDVGPENGRDSTLLAVVFNGCIYNHRELRAELEGKGHRFETDHSDTEVLLHAWRAWRFAMGEHLDAMGSWLLWDRDRATLFAWRAETGEKPLFVAGAKASSASVPGTWVFASTAAACAAVFHGAFPTRRSVDTDSAAVAIMHGYGHPSTSMRALEPGCYPFRVPPDGPSTREGLGENSPDYHHHRHSFSAVEGANLEDRVERTLADAVAERLHADVPVGCLLSGGVDSSLITLLAARAHPDIRSFCVRMPDPRFDESEFAAQAARSIGTRHETLDVHPAPADDLVRLIETIGTPFGDSSLLPTYWAFRAAAAHAKVVLTGDGGDELFLGYERYQVTHAIHASSRARPIASLLAGALTGIGAASHPKSRLAKLERLAEAAACAGYVELIRVFPTSMMRQLSPSASVDGPTPRVRSPLDASRFERTSHFPDGLLAKVDHASLVAHVEARAPFLARRVRDLVAGLGEHELMPHRQRKGLLRAVARKYLPAEIVDRPKMGFAIPIGEWFRSDFGGLRTLLYDMLHSVDPFPASLLGLEINRRFVEQMLDEHMSGRRDHSQRLYMLLVLAIWCRWMGRLSVTRGDN